VRSLDPAHFICSSAHPRIVIATKADATIYRAARENAAASQFTVNPPLDSLGQPRATHRSDGSSSDPQTRFS
jgi:hypothetical protein